MGRDVKVLTELYKGKFGHPTQPNNPYGNNGEFFVGGGGFGGQDRDKSIIDYNRPPGQRPFDSNVDFNTNWYENQLKIKNGECQPGLWCQWTTNGKELTWNGGEKFYYYNEWLEYLIKNFFEPWGVKLNGEVKWEGEDSDDVGKIVVKDNSITIFVQETTYVEFKP